MHRTGPPAITCLIRIVILTLLMAGSTASADRGHLTVPLSSSVVNVSRTAAGPAQIQLGPDAASGEVQWLGPTGAPRLPHRVLTLLLPPNADLGTVDVNLTDARYQQLDGSWDIAPIAPPAMRRHGKEIVHWPTNRNLQSGRDTEIYSRTTPWPSADAWILDTGQLHDWRLVQIAIPLLKYDPAGGVLWQTVAGAVVVTFDRDPSPRPPNNPLAAHRVCNLVANFSSASLAYWNNGSPPESLLGTGRDPTTYAIVTTDAIVAASTQLANFVTHKQSLGLDVQVITETAFGGGAGDDAAENIRSWLQANYAADQISYVLLIGDPDPAAAGVPMKMTFPAISHPTPTDYYFADLTGNWDLDGDGYYGEYADDFNPGGVDRFAEVLVGRIPFYGDVAELDAILAKTIAYETEVDPTWRRSVLLPMRPSDELTPGFHLGEAIKDNLLVVKNWPYHRIYDEDFGLIPPPETTPCTESIVSDVWGGSPFGLVVWWAHGSVTYASGIMSTGGTTSLNDAYPSFTFQATCGNAYAEDPQNLSYALLKNGGVVTIGATRTSWYIVGQVLFANSPSNAGMAYEYAARVVGARATGGFALHDTRERIYPTVMEFWKNYVAFNIYGDPSLHMLPLEARRYVDAAASAGGDGRTWATAYTDLQDALADVPIEIWVAAGTYKPDRGTGDRGMSLQLVNGVEIYGGFAGDETTLFQRDPQANPTILSGDLNGDDAPDLANRDDNSYHVVTGRNTDSTALLDGFIIRSGAANYGSNDDGGGLWCEVSGNPTIRNCIFEDNIAKYGAAVRCDGNSSPTLVNCIFRNNHADVYGYGYGAGLSLNNLSSPLLYNCVFAGNVAGSFGGGLYFHANTIPTLINCTFALNHASNGGGVYGNNSSSDFFVTNSVFWGNIRYVWGQGNVADEYAQIMNCWGIDINHSCVQDWSGSMGGSGNTGADPLLIDADGSDDIPGTADDDLRIAQDSPAIDAGENSAVPAWLLTDMAGSPRIQGGTVDMGAYESAPPEPLPGDCDGDDDVDGDDLARMVGCMAGPAAPLGSDCECTDLDNDTDVDLRDLANFQPGFTGSS